MDPNEILQQLMQLLQPSEADAAMRRIQPQSNIQGPTANPMLDVFAKIQAQQAAQLQREQAMAQLKAALQASAAQTKASGPQAQAQLAVTQAKAEPKPDLASLLGIGGSGGSVEAPSFPGDTFGGGPGAPITFGTNPRTGEQSFNNFGWVNAPTSGSGRAFDVAQQYASPESQAAVEAARPKGTATGTPDKAALIALAQGFKSAGIPIPAPLSKALGEALTGVTPQAIKQGTALGANASKYLNVETGDRATPDITLGEVTTPGTKFVSIDSAQGKTFEALNNIKTHIDLISGFLDKFPKSGWRFVNNIGMAAQAQLGDPNSEVIKDMLSPITSLALSRALIGSGGRAGPALAAQLHNALPAPGDTQAQAQLKLETAQKLITEIAQRNGLPTKPFEFSNSPSQPQPQVSTQQQRVKETTTGRTAIMLPGATLPSGWELTQ
jgi:hypothetical protein